MNKSNPKNKIKSGFFPYAKKCGGCQLTNMTYEQQLSFKTAKVIRLLGKMHKVEDIIGMENPYHYRNKVQAAFCTTRGGKIISGVYQAGSHRVVAVEKCMTEDEKADEIIATVRRLLPRFKLTAYNEDTKKGFLRHVLVKRGFSSGEIMVVLVSSSNIFPRKNDFLKALLKAHPEITTVVWNINSASTSLVLGKRQSVLYGPGKIAEELMGKRFVISPESFYQINPVQTRVLYSTAIDFLALTGKERVIDAYCGTGTIGITLSEHAGEVIGVELNASAVRDAAQNARINDVKNIKFYCADAGDFMDDMVRSAQGADAVIMDPPRAGSTVKFLKSLVRLSPKKIVYISCNPETQARDLRHLINGGYKVRKIQPVDMFPHTSHIETVVLLTRK